MEDRLKRLDSLSERFDKPFSKRVTDTQVLYLKEIKNKQKRFKYFQLEKKEELEVSLTTQKIEICLLLRIRRYKDYDTSHSEYKVFRASAIGIK